MNQDECKGCGLSEKQLNLMWMALFGDGTDKSPGILRKIDSLVEFVEGRKRIEGYAIKSIVALTVTSIATSVALIIKLAAQ